MALLVGIVCLILGCSLYVGFRIRALSFLGRKWAKYLAYFVWLNWLCYIGLMLLLDALDVSRQSAGMLVFTTLLVQDVTSKILLTLVFLLDDIVFFIRYVLRLLHKLYSSKASSAAQQMAPPISRSAFLMKTALITGSLPVVGILDAILRGAHNYQLHTHKIYLPTLPQAFNGLRIIQLSDIHTGSFYSKKAVLAGIDLALQQKPDIILFTGDLVNTLTAEVHAYMDLFSRIRAPLGVFSVLGNHDYGDYYMKWKSSEEKQANLLAMYEVHKQLGWQLLRNSHKEIQLQGESLAIIGVENWSRSSRFPKYGDLSKACKDLRTSCNILLSHDPSHWDAEIRPLRPDISLTCSGHTHGLQCGIEIGDFQWSPAQYLYPQWAGLYKKEAQYLYVNRGFGYLGLPGRLGIYPEVTLLELCTTSV